MSASSVLLILSKTGRIQMNADHALRIGLQSRLVICRNANVVLAWGVKAVNVALVCPGHSQEMLRIAAPSASEKVSTTCQELKHVCVVVPLEGGERPHVRRKRVYGSVPVLQYGKQCQLFIGQLASSFLYLVIYNL